MRGSKRLGGAAATRVRHAAAAAGPRRAPHVKGGGGGESEQLLGAANVVQEELAEGAVADGLHQHLQELRDGADARQVEREDAQQAHD
jgi:hypothetical protein